MIYERALGHCTTCGFWVFFCFCFAQPTAKENCIQVQLETPLWVLTLVIVVIKIFYFPIPATPTLVQWVTVATKKLPGNVRAITADRSRREDRKGMLALDPQGESRLLALPCKRVRDCPVFGK